MAESAFDFAESEDGGCYIPLTPSERSRSSAVLAEVVHRLDENRA